MQKLTIDRTKWLRGKPKEAVLYRPADGQMCCVGIYLSACGLTPNQLGHCGIVSELDVNSKPLLDILPKAAWWLVKETAPEQYRDSRTADELYGENDAAEVSEEHRESKIAELFADVGIEVEFIN